MICTKQPRGNAGLLLAVPPTTTTETIKMLTRKTPETVSTKLTVKTASGKVSFAVTFFNRSDEEVQQNVADTSADERGKKDPAWVNRQQVLFVVKEMETEYPLDDDGIREMERDWPGMIEALFFGYHQARRVELVKN